MSQELPMHVANGAAEADGGSAIDPVCGMAVQKDSARNRGLAVTHDGVEYFFCGRGCKLDFAENPAHFLTPSYQPHM